MPNFQGDQHPSIRTGEGILSYIYFWGGNSSFYNSRYAIQILAFNCKHGERLNHLCPNLRCILTIIDRLLTAPKRYVALRENLTIWGIFGVKIRWIIVQKSQNSAR